MDSIHSLCSEANPQIDYICAHYSVLLACLLPHDVSRIMNNGKVLVCPDEDDEDDDEDDKRVEEASQNLASATISSIHHAHQSLNESNSSSMVTIPGTSYTPGSLPDYKSRAAKVSADTLERSVPLATIGTPATDNSSATRAILVTVQSPNISSFLVN